MVYRLARCWKTECANRREQSAREAVKMINVVTTIGGWHEHRRMRRFGDGRHNRGLGRAYAEALLASGAAKVYAGARATRPPSPMGG